MVARAGPSQDKSWLDIARDAAELAGSVANKIKDGATSAVQALTRPAERTAPPTPPSTSGRTNSRPLPAQRDAPPGSEDLITFPGLPGFVGRALSGLMTSALNKLEAELESQATERDAVYDEAVTRLVNSQRLRSRLGPVTVGPVVSQSTSSSSINGRTTRKVSLALPVFGAGGTTALARVQHTTSDGGTSCQVTVELTDGSVLKIDRDDGAGGGGGGVAAGGSRRPEPVIIDAEFRDVK